MRRQGKFSRITKLGWAFGLGMVFGLGCLPAQAGLQAQEPASAEASPGRPEGQQAASLAGSLHDLQVQMNGLNEALRDLRAEVARSRQESLELRRELTQTREKLASLAAGASRGPSQELPSTGGGAVQRETPVGTPALQPAAPGQRVEERLNKLEEDQQLLSSKVDDQYQTKVESASKYRVRLSGIALINVFGNRGSVDNQDLPHLAFDRGPLDSSGNFGATVRQSSLGLEVFGPKVGIARTSADLEFDFFGGFPYTSNGVTSGLVRLRTARVRVDWPHTSIVAGQDTPFFSPHSPTSLASLALPALSYAGNLWTWTPQVRVEHRTQLSEESSLLVQGGILDPLTGQPPYAQFYRSPQAGENSRQPAYATRIAWNDKVWGEPLTLGIGSYYSRQDWGFRRHVDAWAATADWDLPLGRWFSLSGEFYRGRALGGLGAGAGRSAVFSGRITDPTTAVRGLNTAGGWSQLKFRPTEKWEFNGAFGEDVPWARDLSRFSASTSYVNTSVSRNESGFFNVIYRARSNLLLSAEYRRLWTSNTYKSKDTADHINLSVGVLF